MADDTQTAGEADQPWPVLAPRYQMRGLIAEGGMARVFRVHDTKLGRDIALKQVDPLLWSRPQSRERFVREALAVARLEHPNIVQVFDVDQEHGHLLMELLDGESLEQRAERGPLPSPLVRRIADELLGALAAAHAAGVIHRDVKPSNVMLRSDGRATLVDFGVARLTGVEATGTASSLGTPAYMAPEQFQRARNVDHRADLYSLGATLYFLLCGRDYDPLGSSRRQAFAALRRASPDRALNAVIARCLEPDRERRFVGASQARAGLARRPSRIGPGIGLLTALGLALIAALLLWRWRHSSGRRGAGLGPAWILAQRGDEARARELVGGYLREHPADPEARMLDVLTAWWTQSNTADTELAVARARQAPLDPAQRALVDGVYLLAWGREAEAIEFLEQRARELPGRPEILYTLGEAQFHGQHVVDGIATLRRAFEVDPRWGIALHHVIDYDLSRGSRDSLRLIAARLRSADPAMAAGLESALAFGAGKYDEAASIARQALARDPDCALLWDRLSEAQVLAGDLDGAEHTAREAFARFPVDARADGALGHLVELLAYRGRRDPKLVGLAANQLDALVDLLWLGRAARFVFRPRYLTDGGMRPVPLGAALYALQADHQQLDERKAFASYPEAEVAAYAEGLAAERRGDRKAAAAAYQRGLEVPARGDLRLLLWFHLARVRRDQGDAAGAAGACAEVLAPRQYQVYRAVLTPDCIVWSAETWAPAAARAAYQRLVDQWQGDLDSPAVQLARQRLAGP